MGSHTTHKATACKKPDGYPQPQSAGFGRIALFWNAPKTNLFLFGVLQKCANCHYHRKYDAVEQHREGEAAVGLCV